ncbi:hypothetical protein CV102_14280 [Natronococcus pandeyae]|uniref:Uncharacterized protein n=1 Tax=Natronococcus pandeyae TaxID=2055836 RepID=A0A8J8Q3P2_9EURY|nr:hypothetical protein CV102_14280 [Natronococcus pandeyae]
MPTHIKLYGEKGERFEQIQAELERELGYEPTNPEVIGFLMYAYGNALETVDTLTGEKSEQEAPVRER